MADCIIPKGEREEIVSKIEKHSKDNNCSIAKACKHFETKPHNFYYWKKNIDNESSDDKDDDDNESSDDKDDDDNESSDDKDDDDNESSDDKDDDDSKCKTQLCAVFGNVKDISQLLKQLLFS
jgi:hypothetical protein